MALQLLAANNAQSVLAAGISASATSLTLNTGTGALFPSPVSGTSFFKLTLIDAATGSLTEIVHVTARAGDVFTIQRGQEGTVPRAWSANDIAANMMTAGTLSYILGNFQPLDPTLTALAALVGVANKLPYFNGDDTAALTDLTQVGRDIIGKTTIADVLTYLGLGTGLTGIVGQSRNAAMRITVASSTATWTADELVVETAIGGTQYRLNNLSLSINFATTGAGGMDTGAAPASGFVAIYAIYNPTTKTTAALAVNVTSAKAPEVYGGSNMPAGYTASALIAVCGTNSSGQLLPGLLTDRTWMTPRTIVLNVTVQNSSWTSMTLAAMVPLNAKRVMGDLAGATNSGNITMGGSGDSTNAIGASWPTYYLIGQCPFDVELSSPQTMYYLNTMSSGSIISFQVFIKGYVF